MKRFIYCIYTLVNFLTALSEMSSQNSSLNSEPSPYEPTPSPNPVLMNLGVSRNEKQIVPQSKVPRQVLFRPRFTITRLAKSFNYDYDPFFNKDDFLPFETRKRPVKVIMFKRNRLQPHLPFEENKDNLGVAEQQSPYNEIVDTMLDSNDFASN